jgi:hypothetical protein
MRRQTFGGSLTARASIDQRVPYRLEFSRQRQAIFQGAHFLGIACQNLFELESELAKFDLPDWRVVLRG